ncbi:MAG: hypothetical protein ABSF84_09290 [Acidimicrobiales bacterium]|jgi:hypothetical protein
MPNEAETMVVTPVAPVGASAWEHDLWVHLTEHVRLERGLLDEYAAVARGTRSKALNYLVELLIDDEIRHHRMFEDLADSLTNWDVGEDGPAIPRIDFDAADSSAVTGLVRDLLDRERQDARQLKKLRRQLREVKDTTLWDLLVDLMERDTQKHIALLRFVKRHAGRRRRR